MSISSLGIGSGLDLNALVDRLVAAEREPREKRLNQRESTMQARLSAFGSVRGALAGLETALGKLAGLQEGRRATSSDPGRLAVIATGEAFPQSYTVVVNSLAKAESVASETRFESADATVGTGTLMLRVGEGETIDLVIDGSNNSLRGVRDAINDADAGVRASIVNDGSGSRLVLTAKETGIANRINLSVTEGLSSLAALETVRPAADASVEINGLPVTSPVNTLDQAIEGLTLDLKGVSEAGSPITVEVQADRKAVRDALGDFVKSYNALIGLIAEKTRFNPETREGGVLLGDSTLRGIRSRLSSALAQTGGPPGGLISNLVTLGLRTDLNGGVSLDEGALNQALDSDLAATVVLVNDVAGGMRDTVRGFTETGGLLDTRTDGLRSGIRDVGRQREQLEDRMEQLEARLVRQFSAMDALVGQLQNTSQFLDQQLGALNRMLDQGRRR